MNRLGFIGAARTPSNRHNFVPRFSRSVVKSKHVILPLLYANFSTYKVSLYHVGVCFYRSHQRANRDESVAVSFNLWSYISLGRSPSSTC